MINDENNVIVIVKNVWVQTVYNNGIHLSKLSARHLYFYLDRDKNNALKTR